MLLGRSYFVTFASPLRIQSYRCLISFDFIDFSWIPYLSDIIYMYVIRSAIYVFYSEKGGGGAVNLVFGSLSSFIMAFFV